MDVGRTNVAEACAARQVLKPAITLRAIMIRSSCSTQDALIVLGIRRRAGNKVLWVKLKVKSSVLQPVCFQVAVAKECCSRVACCIPGDRSIGDQKEARVATRIKTAL